MSALPHAYNLSRSSTALNREIPQLIVVEVDIGHHMTGEVGVIDLGNDVVRDHLLVGGVKLVPRRKCQL